LTTVKLLARRVICCSVQRPLLLLSSMLDNHPQG
jgi:hypothetical protein